MSRAWRVLILNWRCPRNPRAGGAELLTYEVARRLVHGGFYVEWFSAAFPGAPSEEILDGVRVVRAGHQWSVHWAAYRRYREKLSGDFDIVIDQVNTIPFFTPLWAKIPKLMFIHQLAREVWWYESWFPLNAIGYLAEPVYLLFYRDVDVMTVSESTRDDLRRLGLRGRITIIPEGIEPIGAMRKSAPREPIFIYVGRLAPSKRLEHMFRALLCYRRTTGAGTLVLVGTGSAQYERRLERLARRLGIASSIQFRGRVSTAEKHALMGQACALLMTSVREGWGLVVTEANGCGTPAIVYDVPGLRDSVRNEVTGLIVPSAPTYLAQAMVRITADNDLRSRLSGQAKQWSATFSFDETARLVAEVLERSLAA